MKRRAAFVTHYWAPHTGGIETVAREQAVRLAARGWETEVFTSRLAGDAPVERRGPITVRRFACMNRLERSLSVPVPIMSPAMFRTLRAVASTFDAMIVHGHAYLGSWYAMAAARSRCATMVVQHSPFVEYPMPLAQLEHMVDRTVGRLVLERADAVVSVSRFTDSYVSSIAPNANRRVIYSGVDTSQFYPAPHQPTGPVRRVLTVRRLVPRNGVDVLIDAWNAARTPAGAELLIAGEGPERDHLRRRAGASESIRFLGFVSDAELPDLYRSCDLFVLPSRSGEGFGLVVAEALACGLPVVVTDAGAPPEFVRHGIDGLVVPAGNAAELAGALELFLSGATSVLHARTHVQSRARDLCWDHSIDQYEALLYVLVDARARSNANVLARNLSSPN